METTTRKCVAAVICTGLFGPVAVLVSPPVAHATTLPADPVTHVASPVALTRIAFANQARRVRAALTDLRSEGTTGPTSAADVDPGTAAACGSHG